MVKKQASGSELQLLKTHIREKNPERLYIFFGEETFLLEHYLGSLKKLVLDALTESFNYHRFNTETFDLTAFSEAVENLPMMAERTLVQVEDIDLFKMNEADRDRIAAVLSDIPEYCVVVFVYTACPWKPDKRMKKLWESIDKNGLVVEFAKQDQRDLIAWLTRHFSAHQKRISTELCAYSAADTICKADIDAVTEPVLDAVVFQMTDLLSAGRYDEALLKLQQLLKMQQEPLAILGAVGSHFRRLGTARTLLDNRKTSADLQKLCGLPDYPARKTMEAARRFSAAFCRKANELVLETDYRIKISYDDPQRLLELLLLSLAREAQNG